MGSHDDGPLDTSLTHLLLSATSLEARTPHVYSPIDEAAQEIRLLTILPGTFDSDIRVCLRATPFTEDSDLEFEALSYVWGSPEDPVDIFIGETIYHTLSVTKSLAEALSYLQYDDTRRVIWIDAICVNQKDMDERTSQMKRMADIYRNASQVVVWLGPESEDSSLAIECCKMISSKVTVNWVLQTMAPSSQESTWSVESSGGNEANLDVKNHLSVSTAKVDWADRESWLPFSDEQCIAMFRLLHRDWFNRLWI